MLNVYGLRNVSLLAMLIDAERVPVALGLKSTWNVVLPAAAMLEAGVWTSEKSAAFVPPITTYGDAPVRLSERLPVFSMVKVLVTVPPTTSVALKSVKSARDGETSPVTILVLFPLMFMMGAGAPPGNVPEMKNCPRLP